MPCSGIEGVRVIVQVGTGLIGASSQPNAIRRGLGLPSGNAAPTESLKRDLQGLAPAGRLALDIGALQGASKGASTAQSLLDAAKTGARAIETVTTQLKALATAAAETGLSNTDRALLNSNFDVLRAEITAIVDRTTFDGVKLLDGNGGASRSFTFTVGGSSGAGASATVEISAATVDGLASGFATADLLTEASATSTKALATTAKEAATGIVQALEAQATAINAGSSVGANASSAVNSTRNGFLQFDLVTDKSREFSADISTEAGIDLSSRGGPTANDLLRTLAVKSEPATSNTQNASATSEKKAPVGDSSKESVDPSQSRKVDIRA